LYECLLDIRIDWLKAYITSSAQMAMQLELFFDEKFPKFVFYFERLLKKLPRGGFYFGDRLACADLLLFIMDTNWTDIRPNCLNETLKIRKAYENVLHHPKIKEYFSSGRRLSTFPGRWSS
jgi:hypothetical protein